MMDNFIWLDETFSINLALVKTIYVDAANFIFKFSYSEEESHVFQCVSQKQFLYLLEYKLDMNDYLMAKYQRLLLGNPW